MTNVAVRVEGLGKQYRISHQQRERYRTLRDVIADRFRNLLHPPAGEKDARPRVEEFWALRGVSFEVSKGEVVGIIGRNGAGKSTLLKILSRITAPSEGHVELDGRVASMLEVGTGFHPELTGRENIFLNGAILGMQRSEIERKFDEIVAFAEVEKFLDTPVKRYSSGMAVRLAFAVAAHLEPEILVIDEVLAVGDAAFQRRCLDKMGEVCGAGRTILFVSHQMQAVRQLCERAVWLDKGGLVAVGPCDEIIDRYLSTGRRSELLQSANDEIATLPPDPAFRLKRVDVMQDGLSATELVSGKAVEVRVEYDVLQDACGLHVYFLLCDMDGTLLFESLHNGDSAEHLPLVQRGSYVSTALIPADFLAGRSYELQIQAGIQGLRAFLKRPVSIGLRVHSVGLVNRAYAGYETPGKLAPLIRWRTEEVDTPATGEGPPAGRT